MGLDLEGFTIEGTTEMPDGSLKVDIEVTDEFKARFKVYCGMKRWSQRRFERWFNESLKTGLNLIEHEMGIDNDENSVRERSPRD